MKTATIPGVELVRVGNWNAVQGDGGITPEDLQACVEAYRDHMVDRAPIKLGHQENNRLNEDASTNGGFGDGEPAYGWVENLRLSDDGKALVGDYVGMPAKLAQVAPTAWRRRSIELLRNVTTAAGKTYKAALAGVALLGIMRPAAKGLQDVLDLYSGAETAGGLTVLELVDGMTASQVSAFAGVLEDLRSVHDTDAVPHESGAGADADRVENDTTTKEAPMGKGKGLTKESVLAALDAEGDQAIEDRLAALLDEDEKPEGDEKPAGDKPAGDKPADEKPEGDKPAGDKPEGDEVDVEKLGEGMVVTLSKAQFAELMSGAQAGKTAAEKIAADERKQIIRTALSEGRIAPADKDKWETQLEKDTEGTKTLLAGLTPVFPVAELGDDAQHETTQLTEAQKAAEDEFLDTFGPARA